MQHFNKDRLLHAATERLDQTRKRITSLIPETKQSIAQKTAGLPSLDADTRYAREAVIERLKQKIEDLDLLYPSPYFIKCMVRFDTDDTDRIFYFSKLPLTEEDIYSWTAPAAVLRFQEPGAFTYPIPGGNTQSGQLLSKEQYLITDGRILFMAAEDTEYGRELIYQEHFSKRKTDFLLPEIIEQLEAAQDKAIRTPANQNLLINGPAGSGKTTLALHRIAYLLQAPEAAERFKAEDAIVFVNDHNTKNYFSGLLPQLGIHHVTITTFGDFTRAQLHILAIPYQERARLDEDSLPTYEYHKLQALQSGDRLLYIAENPFLTLKHTYARYLPNTELARFIQQMKDGYLDRLDLTILLASYVHTHGPLQKNVTVLAQQKAGRVKRTKKQVPLEYSLMVLDEVQNYLPEQLTLLQQLTAPFGSRMYVGDLAQQTKLFTVRNWAQVGETFTDTNTVKLDKVYRSTRQILEYIQAAGFATHIPDNARDGDAVEAYAYTNHPDRDQRIADFTRRHGTVTVGILARDIRSLSALQQHYTDNPLVKILSIYEAQGVEFDAVCLIDADTLLAPHLDAFTPQLAAQVQQVNKDLLYVALTRAMNNLYILNHATA